MKRIRTALLAIALFLGSLAAAGAQSEKWYGHVTVKVSETQSALMSLRFPFDEQAECQSQLVVAIMYLGAQGAEVTNGWCSTKTFEETMEEIKKGAGQPA